MTTEDNEDQEALELRRVLELTVSDPDEFLETLALAGYTVVKTQWEYGVKPGAYTVIAAEDEKDARRLSSRWNASVFRRRACGHWERLPESDTLQGGEQ